jgi:NTP pyrophosphatase (non-canonical NTP hydrolase)
MITDETAAKLAALSEWVDTAPANAGRDREAALWGRVAKVSEECGEVIAALVGATGQNPRKGVTHCMVDVEDELLDVALTALCAVEHLSRNKGVSMDAFAHKVAEVFERAGLAASPRGDR